MTNQNNAMQARAIEIAQRNLRAYLGKSSFASQVDRGAALECLDTIDATLASAQADPEAAEVDFRVRVLESLDAWRAEDWSELLERRPAILALLRPMVLASAPVAQAEVMAALHYVDDFIARCNGNDRGSCESVNILRRALASAPVSDNWQQYALSGETTAEQVCERMNAEVTRRTVAAMRASAPVAGEATEELAKLAEELGDLASDMAYEANQEMDQDKASRAALIERGERALRGFVDAAPQASEAVRDGCAEGYEKMRDVLQWIVDDAGSGGVAKLRPQQEKRALAALSAQPGAQEGTSDE